MINIYIVSDWYQHFDAAIHIYLRRLPHMRLHIIKPEKTKDAKRAKKQETNRIITAVSRKQAYTFLLDLHGKQYTTESLYTFLENTKLHTPHVNYIIGGSYGVDVSLLAWIVDQKLSFWIHTLPHSLALLVLLEQLFRIESIQKGSKYHH